jgi:hypothetical protein
VVSEAQRLAWIRHQGDRGLLGTLSNAVNEMCAPLWWSAPEADDPAKRRQAGTVCLVRTPERLIGITANHVHAAVASRLDNGLSET